MWTFLFCPFSHRDGSYTLGPCRSLPGPCRLGVAPVSQLIRLSLVVFWTIIRARTSGCKGIDLIYQSNRLRLKETHMAATASWMELDHPKRPPGSLVPAQALMQILLAEDGDVHRRTREIEDLRTNWRLEKNRDMSVDLELIHIQIEGAPINRLTILSKSLCAIRQFSWATASTSRGCFHCIANRGYCGILRNIATMGLRGEDFWSIFASLPSNQRGLAGRWHQPCPVKRTTGKRISQRQHCISGCQRMSGLKKNNKQNKPTVPDLVINGAVQNWSHYMCRISADADRFGGRADICQAWSLDGGLDQ